MPIVWVLGFLSQLAFPERKPTTDVDDHQRTPFQRLELEEGLGASTWAGFGLAFDIRASELSSKLNRAIASGLWDKAEQITAELENYYPKTGLSNFCRGQIDFKQGNLFSAIRHLEAAADLAPESELAHLNLGLSYAAIRQYRLFEQDMKRIIAKNDTWALPHYYLGQYYISEAQQLATGAQYFRNALQRNPSDFKSRYYLGYIHELQNEFDHAIVDFQTAMNLAASQGSKYSLPHQGLARIYAARADTSRALEYARAAVSLEPGVAAIRLTLGKLYLQREEYEKAVQELIRTAQIDTTDPSPHYLLSKAYLKLGRSEDARREQKTFLELKTAYAE